MATLSPSLRRGSRSTSKAGSTPVAAMPKQKTASYRHALIGDATLESRTLEGSSDKPLSLSASEWQRMRNVTMRVDPQQTYMLAAKSERDALHQTSQNMVKTWDNTLEGARLKKLQRLKLKADAEEEASKKLDLEEAEYQAERRKEAIAKARQGLVYETDRVKKFHESLVLSEVLREREAQVEFKRKKEAMRQGLDHQYVQRMREDHRLALLDEKEKARQRLVAAQHTCDFQGEQIREKRSQGMEERQQALKEQLESDRIAEEYFEEQRALEQKQAEDKVKTKRLYDRTLQDKRAAVEQKKLEDKVEDDEIMTFSTAKQAMTTRRKHKERALLKAVRDKQDAMCDKLYGMALKQRDTEDQEIAKAQEEAYAKRDQEVREKQDRFVKRQREINEHRVQVMAAHEEHQRQEAARQAEMAQQQRDLDKQFYVQQQLEETRKRQGQLKLQDELVQQVQGRLDKEDQEIAEQLEHDRQNVQRHKEEEEEFHRYAASVITEAKQRGAPTHVLERAAMTGACGGRGPEFPGKGGIKPNYMTKDKFGTELHSFGPSRILPAVNGSHTTGKGKSQRVRGLGQQEGDTKKRTGFVW